MPANTDPPALDKADPVLQLLTHNEALYVHRYPGTTAVPGSLFDAQDSFVTVSRTPREVSVVAAKGAPAAAGMPNAAEEHCGGPWTAIRVRGPLEHHMVGVLSEIARVLKEASISIFAISTWDTDYILVTSDTLERAKEALAADGWRWA
ncbi:hypothetical protein CC85DRAFT_300966 [Cutaneotrichosporon oleaginosum]|uniref:CASTOR ACT domain-containing protein n=1 Tax=Cutaneotrichosporon oleaginosum TaxID=879819 RepID=A0A0J1B7Q5_9TREE|nr:uncharacterized protein CC85DRAFT_300966 [Cutaneotrichosporon oleaginosum]KLT43794.1 hypothetical protein CC85DRAFT_300966 [Cutaneotrichosporon oleaginosum]TXT06464.1 hypothetical protein COLE_05795 [Cutaneotrichosporon oleaginosum]